MHDLLPGTDQPGPDLLTGPEVVHLLRLDFTTKSDGTEHPREMADSLKSLDHLVRKGRIRPCRVGKCRRYARLEIERFIRESTAGKEAGQ